MNISDYQLYRARNISKERWSESSPTTKTFPIENLIEGLNSECEFHIREDSRVLPKAAVFGDMLWWVKINKFPVARFAKRKLLLIYTFVKGSKYVLMWKQSMKIKVNHSQKDFHLIFLDYLMSDAWTKIKGSSSSLNKSTDIVMEGIKRLVTEENEFESRVKPKTTQFFVFFWTYWNLMQETISKIAQLIRLLPLEALVWNLYKWNQLFTWGAFKKLGLRNLRRTRQNT